MRSYSDKKKQDFKKQKLYTELCVYFVIACIIGCFALVISR